MEGEQGRAADSGIDGSSGTSAGFGAGNRARAAESGTCRSGRNSAINPGGDPSRGTTAGVQAANTSRLAAY